MADDLDSWIAQETPIAVRNMLKSISAVDLVHHRREFGQQIRPVRGSILASPVSARYDPDPDYFFHWQRDAAVVLDAVIGLIGEGMPAEDGHRIVADVVAFTRGLDALDGRTIAGDPGYGATVPAESRQFLRSREELAGIHGDGIRMEPRFNPDGTLDIFDWGRPQLDGTALRALVLMRYARRFGSSPVLDALIEDDLDFSLRHAGRESFDIWEERNCADYYTRSVQQQTLAEAAAGGRGGAEKTAAFEEAAERLLGLLDDHWSPDRNCYLSAAHAGAPTDRDVDVAVIFAALHSVRNGGRHSVCDPRVQATLATLARVFAGDYAINRAHPDAAPAMGRYRGDVYVSGGAFYFSTFGAAEFCYRLAGHAAENGLTATPENTEFLALTGLWPLPGDRQAQAAALMRSGDGFLETVRAFTPAAGDLSEQFDQTDGHPTSARHLAWSYAAFLTATAARGGWPGSDR